MNPAQRLAPFLHSTLAMVLLAVSAARLFAQTPSASFDAANKLYEEGKFTEAAAAYQKLAHSGRVSEALYFNWGNALFKAGQVGRAIDAYQHAERIAPRDPDVRANLQFARNQVQGPTLLPDRFARWLGKLSLNEWTWTAAAALWAWLLLLTLIQLRPTFKPALKSYAIGVGVLVVVLAAGFWAAFYFDCVAQRAIVVTSETVARQAPLEESQNAFTLHDGAELQVIDQKDDWLQVRADSNRIGWVRKDSLRLHPSG